MEGQEDPDPTNPSAKDPSLCDECKAMGRAGGVAVLDAGDNTATPVCLKRFFFRIKTENGARQFHFSPPKISPQAHSPSTRFSLHRHRRRDPYRNRRRLNRREWTFSWLFPPPSSLLFVNGKIQNKKQKEGMGIANDEAIKQFQSLMEEVDDD